MRVTVPVPLCRGNTAAPAKLMSGTEAWRRNAHHLMQIKGESSTRSLRHVAVVAADILLRVSYRSGTFQVLEGRWRWGIY